MARTAKAVLAFVQKKTNKNTYYKEGNKMNAARPTHNRKICMQTFNSEGLPFVAFDFETSGLNIFLDRPVQISAIKCQIKDGHVEQGESYTTYIHPTVNINPSASEKTGITLEFLKEQMAPEEDEVFSDIYRIFGDSCIVCGYNITAFDVPILQEMYKRHGKIFTPAAVIDVCEMVRDIVPANAVKSRSQEEIAKLYGLNSGIQFHDAADDVKVCLRILERMHEEYLERPEYTGQKERLFVNYVFFREGHNRSQKGLYVKTQFDTITVHKKNGKTEEKKVNLWYSTMDKCWYSAQLDLTKFDIDALTWDVLMKLGISLPDLGRLTEKKVAALRARGVLG